MSMMDELNAKLKKKREAMSEQVIGEIGDTEKKDPQINTFQAKENASVSIRAQMTVTTVENTIEEVKVVSPPKPRASPPKPNVSPPKPKADQPVEIKEVKKKGPAPIPAEHVIGELEEEKSPSKSLAPPEPVFTPQSSMDILTKPVRTNRMSARFDPHAETNPEETEEDELKGV